MGKLWVTLLNRAVKVNLDKVTFKQRFTLHVSRGKCLKARIVSVFLEQQRSQILEKSERESK